MRVHAHLGKEHYERVRAAVTTGSAASFDAAPEAREQDIVNRQLYWSPAATRWYREQGLSLAETAALLKYQPAFSGRDVLDIGVGLGRTTTFLAPLAHRYVGIDYSPVMVEQLRKIMPDVALEQADMRDLSLFKAGEFDFVLGACNVIDAVSHEDRLRTLAQVHRTLRDKGLFVFTSHNRSDPSALAGPELGRSSNPIAQTKHLLSYRRSLRNHAKVSRLRRFETEYALLNDVAHEWSLLHYYIDRTNQARQLERSGFRLLDVFSASGK